MIVGSSISYHSIKQCRILRENLNKFPAKAIDISGMVVGESPDCLLLSGTVVGKNPDHVCWVPFIAKRITLIQDLFSILCTMSAGYL